MSNHVAPVVWITGLSGVGKTTIAKELQRKLQHDNVPCVLLDGDELRDALNDPNYGYDRNSRLLGAYRYARLARLISKQGITTIVSTISLFHEIQDWNRLNQPVYMEVFVEASLETVRRRDSKGLYALHANGKINQMSGLDISPEYPKNPTININTDQEQSAEKNAARILEILQSQSPH